MLKIKEDKLAELKKFDFYEIDRLHYQYRYKDQSIDVGLFGELSIWFNIRKYDTGRSSATNEIMHVLYLLIKADMVENTWVPEE